MGQFVPYLRPYIGELLRMDEQTEFLWYPVDPSNAQTGVNYQGYVINPTERVLSPICIWDPPGDTDWHIVAGFALFATDSSNVIKNYLCFEARIYDDTSVGYTVDYRWTIRENSTGYPLLFNFGTTTTVYAIPGAPSKDNPQVVFNQGIRNGHYWIAMGIYCRGTYEYGGDTFKLYYPASLAIKADVIDEQYGFFDPDRSIEEVDDPNDDPENPADQEDGGGGEHKRPVDRVPFPDIPSAGGMNAGFVTMYKLTPAEMWLFSQSFFTDTLLEALRDFFGNPMDIFVGLGIVPFIPEGNELWYPKIGNSVYISNHPLTRISNQYYVLDCGSIKLDEYGKNALDYAPYTKVLIWLPYIGYRQLPVDEVMGKNIHVKYYCDCLGGDCVAIISTQVMPQGMKPPVDVVIAQYNGNILTQVPVASVSYDNLISNVVNSAIGGIGVMADAAAGGLDGSAVTKQINSLTSAVAGVVNGMKPVMKRDGSPGSSSGLLSVQKPYIVRHIPNQSLPSNYVNVIGYPSNIGGSLGDGFSGLAIVEDIQLNNIPAMEPEREEIKELLREGVII